MAVLWLSLAWLMFWLGKQLLLRPYDESGLDLSSLADYVSAFLYQPYLLLSALLLAGTATAIAKKFLWNAVRMIFHWQNPSPYKGLGMFVGAFFVAVQGYGYFPRLVLFLAAFFVLTDAYRLWNRPVRSRQSGKRGAAGQFESAGLRRKGGRKGHGPRKSLPRGGCGQPPFSPVEFLIRIIRKSGNQL